MIARAGLHLRQWIFTHHAGAPGAVVDFTAAHPPEPVPSCSPGSTVALPGMTVRPLEIQQWGGQSVLVRSSRCEIVRAALSSGSSMVSCITRALVRLACPLMFSAATIWP